MTTKKMIEWLEEELRKIKDKGFNGLLPEEKYFVAIIETLKKGGEMSNEIDKEGLMEECELAFNSAIAKAHQQYPYRKKRIECAKKTNSSTYRGI